MIFNVNEVFLIAARIERNGQAFYRKAVEVTSASEIMHIAELNNEWNSLNK